MVNDNIKKNGTKSILGTYILEGSVSYIEQQEGDDEIVRVVTCDGIDKNVPIIELEEFIDKNVNYYDIKKELRQLTSIIKGE